MALLQLRPWLAGRCVTLLCDNLSACRVLQNRSKALAEIDDNVIHRLLLSIANISFNTVYISTKAQVADFLSRNPAATDPDVPAQLSLHSPCISDLDDKDLNLYTECETLEGYLSVFERKRLKVEKLAKSGWGINYLRDNYSSSHVFPSNMTDFLGQDEIFSCEIEGTLDGLSRDGARKGEAILAIDRESEIAVVEPSDQKTDDNGPSETDIRFWGTEV